MIWTGERARQQRLLVAEMYRAADGVPCERRAAIAGGLPGADKAAALDRAGLDRTRYLTVSIDAILDRMAAAGLISEAGGHEASGHEAGGHEPAATSLAATSLAPTSLALTSWRPEADGSSPLERAGQVHAEAQYLAKRVLLRALMDGRNLILDISLASWRAAEAWTYALRFADYEMTAVFAEIGVDEAVRRAEEAQPARRGGVPPRARPRRAGHPGRGHPRAGQPGRGRGRQPHQVGGRRPVRRGHRRHGRLRDLPRQRRDRDAHLLPGRPDQLR